MTEEKRVVEGRIRLNNVRASFVEAIFTAKSFRRDDGTETDPRYNANFLFPKDIETQEAWETSATYKGKTGPILILLKKAKLDAIAVKTDITKARTIVNMIKPNNYAVRDGNYEKYDGYAGCFFVSAANKRRPQVIGRDRRPIREEDGIIYSGCFVNCFVTLWYQASGLKKGNPVAQAVYAALEAVQFVEDGEAFGAPTVDVDDDFEDLTGGQPEQIEGDVVDDPNSLL